MPTKRPINPKPKAKSKPKAEPKIEPRGQATTPNEPKVAAMEPTSVAMIRERGNERISVQIDYGQDQRGNLMDRRYVTRSHVMGLPMLQDDGGIPENRERFFRSRVNLRVNPLPDARGPEHEVVVTDASRWLHRQEVADQIAPVRQIIRCPNVMMDMMQRGRQEYAEAARTYV